MLFWPSSEYHQPLFRGFNKIWIYRQGWILMILSGKRYFRYFRYEQKYARLAQVSRSVSLFETFASNWPFDTIIKLSKNKILMSKLLVISFLIKLYACINFLSCHFFPYPLNILIIGLAQANSYRFCLTSFPESEILWFFPISYNESKLLAKILKSLYQDTLLCRS